MSTHNPLTAANEVRDQISSKDRKIGFFLGAGTSKAVGLPGIEELTEKVEQNLDDGFQSQYKEVKGKIDDEPNVEDILDRVRAYQEILKNSTNESFGCLESPSQASELDAAICSEISTLVKKEMAESLGPYDIFSQWVRSVQEEREWPIEIFTTNYDLMIERSLEKNGIPFFDGFLGAEYPFFIPESVQGEYQNRIDGTYPPKNWCRLWKLHGSINWFQQDWSGTNRITRVSGQTTLEDEKLMIFPSREKYIESRKVPFLTFQDRLREFLTHGESLLVILGYSMSDQHINEIIFQGLRSNSRLAVMNILFSYDEYSDLLEFGKRYRNFSIYSPKKACIGGISSSWDSPTDRETDLCYWDEEEEKFLLGDFEKFGEYLESYVGFRNSGNGIKANDS